VVTDETGASQGAIYYKPFGATLSGSVPTDHQYTQQEFDDETTLYNYNARLYDPSLGRFMSADSMVPSPSNPQSLNRYSYVMNNPMRYTDPSGHWGISIGAFCYAGAQANYDFTKGRGSIGVGVGFSANASIYSGNVSIGGGSGWNVQYGYDSFAHSEYVSGSYGANIGNFGVGVSGTYDFRSYDYQVGANAGYKNYGVNVGHSRYGGNSVGAGAYGGGASYNFKSGSWSYSYQLTTEQVLGNDVTSNDGLQTATLKAEGDYGVNFSDVSYRQGGLWSAIYGLFGMGGMTIGETVNVAEGTLSLPEEDLNGFIGHELYHVIDYRIEGTAGFLGNYIGYAIGNLTYKNIPAEVNARAASGYPSYQ